LYLLRCSIHPWGRIFKACLTSVGRSETSCAPGSKRNHPIGEKCECLSWRSLPGGGEQKFGISELALGVLITALADIKGLDRIRYMTSHPKNMDATLIAAHKNIEKLMPFLHLPVQSGSDIVLKAMNRKHDVSLYLHIIGKVRQARKDIAFSSDFIVGFPGETDRDFSQTLQLIDTVKFAQAYSFKYSLRPGTPGALREDQIPENIKDERLQQVQQRLKHHQRAFNQQMLGKTVPVLLEKAGRTDGQWVGRTPFMQSVHIRAGADQRVIHYCNHFHTSLFNKCSGSRHDNAGCTIGNCRSNSPVNTHFFLEFQAT